MRRHAFPLCLVLSASLATATAAGQPAGDFAAAARAAAALPRLQSLMVSTAGEVVFEYHARGISASRPANIKSAGKSLISALVGIAIDRGLIAAVS